MLARFLATAALTLALPGCSGTGSNIAPAPPAPLAQTTIDESGLILAWRSYDTVLDAVDAMIAVGVIRPDTPRALTLARGLRQAAAALNAASAARRAGSASDYFAALGQATVVITAINQAINSRVPA